MTCHLSLVYNDLNSLIFNDILGNYVHNIQSLLMHIEKNYEQNTKKCKIPVEQRVSLEFSQDFCELIDSPLRLDELFNWGPKSVGSKILQNVVENEKELSIS